MERSFKLAAALVLPLAALLLAQWPLRDLVQAYSTLANDAAQILFAVYMAFAVTAATRDGTHLAAGHGHTGPAPRWRHAAVLACVGPWAVFMLWHSAAPVLESVRRLERFGETLNPGYFLIKLSLWLLAGLVLAQGLKDLRGGGARHA